MPPQRQRKNYSPTNLTYGKVYNNPYNAPSITLEPIPTVLSPKHDPIPATQIKAQTTLLVNVSTAGRNVCKAAKRDPKTCGGKKIEKNELRVGMDGFRHGGRNWRHWDCLTPGFVEHMKKCYPEPEDLPGFADLATIYQNKVRLTYNPVPARIRRKGEIPPQLDRANIPVPNNKNTPA